MNESIDNITHRMYAFKIYLLNSPLDDFLN